MQTVHVSTMMANIKYIESFSDLQLLELAIQEQFNKLRAARTNPCLHFVCNGSIIDKKCNMCGQSYV